MKNIVENISVALVGILSLLIVFLIAQYNMIDDSEIIENVTQTMIAKKKTKKEQRTSYLNNLEGYEDVDVGVDASKDEAMNKVVVQSEMKDDLLKEAVEDKEKSSYMENLERYAEPKKEELVAEAEEAEPLKIEEEPQMLEDTVDEIGMAIEDALSDL